MEKIVKIKSSSSNETYDVTLKNVNGIISLKCTCQAGMYGMICKHRTDLLNGDISSLLNLSDGKVVEEFLNSIEKGKIENLFTELRDVEKEIEKLNKKKSQLKKEIANKMSEGF